METYEEWDMTIPPLPPRSRLYRLEPIGIGTPYVESLTSYFIRLAEEHHVFPGMLMKKVVEPLVRHYSQQKDMHHYYTTSGNQSNLLNPIGSPAITMVHVLEQLTLRAGLRNLTLLNWAEVLSIRNLVRQVRAWCPICYQDWHTRGEIVYDPLLWVLEPVTMCMRHHCRLSTKCPHQSCQQSLPLLAWRSQPGCCVFCQRWLGVTSDMPSTSASDLKEVEVVWQQWVMDNIGNLLALTPMIEFPPTQKQVHDKLALAIRYVSKGNTASFARSLGVNKERVKGWITRKNLLDIEALLQVCYFLGCSLREFLLEDALTYQLREVNRFPLKTLRKSTSVPTNRATVWQMLEKTLTTEEDPPPSVREMARRLNCNKRVLYECHPTACNRIATRYKEYIRRQAKERVRLHREEIRRVSLALHTAGAPISYHNVNQHLSRPGRIPWKEFSDHLNEIRRELVEDA
ncbi:MAG TPA: TniQ family protein [Ktedonobacteraceae bacterium]